MNPPKSILDRSFKYRNSAETDLEETFKRIRRQMAEAQKATQQTKPNVTAIKRAKP